MSPVATGAETELRLKSVQSSVVPRYRELGMILACSLLVRGLFLVFFSRALSVDLLVWTTVARVLSGGQNPYLATPYLNYPPAWILMLSVLSRISLATGVSLIWLLRSFLIAVEIGEIAVVWATLRRFETDLRRFLLLCGLALNPIAVLQICQHGNFDVLVGLGVLITVWQLIQFQRHGQPADWLLGAAILGVSIALKTVPFVLIALFAAGARRLSITIRALGAFLIIGPAIYGTAVLALADPVVWRKIISYRSLPGWFGVTGYLHILHLDNWLNTYATAFAILFLAVVIGWTVYLYRRSSSLPYMAIIASALLPLLLILFLGPGYGPQYISWFWPLLLVGYPAAGRSWRFSAAVFAGVAVATYFFEYAFLESLGAFLLRTYPTSLVQEVSLMMRSFRLDTLIRTPLWLAYGMLTVTTFRELRTFSDPSCFPAMD